MISILALIVASIFEVLWVTLLGDLTENKSIRNLFLLIVSMLLSLYCLSFASKSIPITVTYSVWVGVGVLGQAVVQQFIYAKTLSLWTWFFTLTLTISIIGLLSQSQKGVY